ncbi:MAG: hypothetical protein ACYC3L_06665 [Gemmatimonadaceae bacterium]
MSSGLLDFFTLEASEYVEHLDGLVAKAAGGPPELEGFIRNARALRGSATMARVGGIADVAGALERVAHALQTGALTWSDALRGASIAAIDDLKILVRGVRAWGDPEARRAAARAQELAGFAPAAAHAGAAAPGATAGATAFLAAETGELARLLADFAASPVGPADFAGTLQRVRALRGMAVLKDLPPLPEVVDALDSAAKAFELSGAVTPALRTLVGTAAQLLADGSIALSRGDRPATASLALSDFAAAASAFSGGALAADDIVPISALFPADGSGGVVSAAPTPPTTAAQRFRREVVSHAEHLRRLVDDAAHAVDAATRERLGRELGAAAHAVSRMAGSFAEDALAQFFAAQREQAALLARHALEALDRACGMLTAPHGPSTSEIARQLSGPAATEALVDVATLAPDDDIVDVATLAPAGDIVEVATLAPDGEPSLVSGGADGAATSGDALHAMLEQGIAGLSGLDEAPLAEPAVVADDVTVPIEDLLYRGKDALDRAIELRDAMRAAGGTPDPTMLAELFDLLELAATTD